MIEDGSPYSYMRIVKLFRRFYRECYMRQTVGHSSDNAGTAWPNIMLSLEGVLPSHLSEAERINRSLVVVTFNRDLGNEIWAMNFVAPADDGSFVGIIAVDKRLYEVVIDEREEAQKRKAILAHEFLELLHTLCNFDHYDYSRSVAGRVEMYALMGALEIGLPWQDTAAHMSRLLPALRDLLVSGETINRLIREDPDHRTSERFYEAFTCALRESRASAETFLARFSEQISKKINVNRVLVRSRVEEILRLGPSAPNSGNK